MSISYCTEHPGCVVTFDERNQEGMVQNCPFCEALEELEVAKTTLNIISILKEDE